MIGYLNNYSVIIISNKLSYPMISHLKDYALIIIQMTIGK